MKRVSGWILAAFLFSMILPAASMAQTGEPLYLLAAKESRVKAQKWIDFLKQYDQPVEHYFLSEADEVKKQDYIAITGGLNEPGFRDLLLDVVGADGVASIENGDKGTMLLKKDVWKQGQMVLVFAGKTAEAAAEARNASKEEWMEYLDEWFDLEEIPGGLRAY